MQRNQYLALQQERTDLIAEGRALFDAADAEGRALSEEEKARDDAIAARLGAVTAELERWERQHERERTAPAAQVVAVGGDPKPDTSKMSAFEKIKYGLAQYDQVRGA